MQNKEQKNKPFSLKGLNKEQISGGAYSLSAVLPTLISLLFLIVITAAGLTEKKNYQYADWYLYASYLITPLSFLAVSLLAFTKTNLSVTETLVGGKKKYYLLAILLQFGLFSLSEVNTLFLSWLNKAFGYQSAQILLPNVSGANIVGVILVVAALPALFEELFFRGVLMQGLRGYGAAFSVLVCGGLFALYHQNPAQTAYQFCCGAAFALIAYRSGSIFPTAISHFINNAAIIVLYAIGLDEFSTAFKIPFLICSGLSLVGSLAYLIFFDKNGENEGGKPKKKDFFLYAAVGIILFSFTWLTSFFSGV